MRIALSRLVAAGVLLGGITFATNVSAQRGGGGEGGGGGEDRFAQFQKMMMDRMREQFEVKDDAEWTLISGRLGKVMELRRSSRGGGFPGGFGGGRGTGGQRGGDAGGRDRPEADRPPGGAGGTGGGEARPERTEPNREGDRGRADRGDRGGRPAGGEPNPAQEALEKALESDASVEVIKAKLTALRASRIEDEAKLKKAQTELREVLSLKQEARAVVMGLLD